LKATTTNPKTYRFEPKLWPTLIAISVFVVVMGLGTWQVQRLLWKGDLIAHREAQLAAPALPLGDDLSGIDETFAFRRVSVSGEFLHDNEIYLAASHNRVIGFKVITPLRRSDGSVVLVDRGFVPSAARPAWLRGDGQVAGVVTIDGVVRASPRRGSFTPDNDLEKNYWFWFDYVAMAAFAGVEAPPFVVEAGPAENPGGLPMGRELRVELRNEHLSYAITWYCLALALVVIYGLSQRVEANPAKDLDNG
jgi:surfeit locus 1 family protein